MRNDLRALRKENEMLHDRCNAHFVDNNSLKGTPMHMAHHMVKAGIDIFHYSETFVIEYKGECML